MRTENQNTNTENASDIYLNLVDTLNAPDNIKNALKNNVKKWETGKKIARSAYMIPICRKLCQKQQSCAESVLVCLDAVVNSLDDTMDVARPTKAEKWEREVTKTISMLIIFRELGTMDKSIQKAVTDKALQFIISLSQIPWVEKDFAEKILKSNSDEDEIKNSILCVKERSRDIDLFLDIALMVSGVSGKEADTIRKAVKNYRTLEIFWKDLADIDLDIENNSKTQTVILFEKHGKNETFRKTLKQIAERLYNEIETLNDKNEAVLYIKHLAKEKYQDSIKRITDL